MASGIVWFPAKRDLYASLAPIDLKRELCQGDVFDEIPFARFPDKGDASDEVPKTQRGMGMVVEHPCVISPSEKGAITPWRTLCRVIQDKGAQISLDGTGHFFAFPLPGLKSDESLWYADFRYVTVIEDMRLRPERRVAALSVDGWLALQRRIAHFYSRGLLDLEYLAVNASHHPDGGSVNAEDESEPYTSRFVQANRSD